MNKHIDSEAYYRRCRDSHTLHDYNESLVFCKRALTAKSNHYNAHFQWGLSLIDKEAYDQSARKHKEILLRNPRDSWAYYNFGVTLDRKDKLLEAEAHYRKSLEIDQSTHSASHNLAIILTKQGRYTEAIEQYEKNLKDNSYQSSNYNSYGYLKFILGKYEEAIQSFEVAIEKDSSESVPFCNKSMAFYCLGKTEIAIEIFKESLDCVKNLQKKLEKSYLIYKGELCRFEELSDGEELGEVSREQVGNIIKAIRFILDLIQSELSKMGSSLVEKEEE